MPTVKTYDNPTVQQQGLPNARMVGQRITGADPDAFGAVQAGQAQDIGEQLARANYAMSKERAKQQELDDATEVFDKKNKFREGLLTIQQQAKQRQGSNAKGVTEWADAEIAKLRDQHLGELKNDRQKSLFVQDAEGMRVSARGSFMDYESGQLEAGLDDKWQASKELAVRQAQSDPASAGKIEAEIMRANQFQAVRKGWDPEVLEAENRKDLTKMHTGILDGMVDADNLAGAQSYLKQHREQIDPGSAAGLEKKIRSKAMDAYSSSVADRLIAEGSSYADALTMVEKNYKGEDKDKVLSKVRERYGDMERIKRERAEEEIEKIEKMSYQGGGMHTVSDATIERLALYDPGKAQTLREKKEKEQENLANGGNRFAKQTNYTVMEQINKLVESGDIRKPEQLDKFAGDLEKRDYEALRNTMNSKSGIEAKDVLLAYKERAGIKPGEPLNEKQTAEYSQFLQGVTGYIKDTSRPQDLDTLADKFFIDKNNKDSWFFDKELPRNAITEDAIGSQERREKGLMNNPDYAKAQEILRGMGKTKAANDPAMVMRFMQQNGMIQ